MICTHRSRQSGVDTSKYNSSKVALGIWYVLQQTVYIRAKACTAAAAAVYSCEVRCAHKQTRALSLSEIFICQCRIFILPVMYPPTHHVPDLTKNPSSHKSTSFTLCYIGLRGEQKCLFHVHFRVGIRQQRTHARVVSTLLLLLPTTRRHIASITFVLFPKRLPLEYTHTQRTVRNNTLKSTTRACI